MERNETFSAVAPVSLEARTRPMTLHRYSVKRHVLLPKNIAPVGKKAILQELLVTEPGPLP